jgi:uncharacterized cupredoxin-like copper-binding protein
MSAGNVLRSDSPRSTSVASLTLVRRSQGRPRVFRTGDEEAGRRDVRIDLAPGETETVAIEAPAGEYKLFCDVAEHATRGMGGAIIAR